MKILTGLTGLKRMEFWSTGVLLYKIALQYSIPPIKDPPNSKSL
jgi:hypothetical protein